MRRGMVARDLVPPLPIDRGSDLVTNAQLTGRDCADVRDDAISRLLRVLDPDSTIPRGDRAGVAYLTAGLGVERCAIDEHLDGFTFAHSVDGASVLAQSRDLSGRGLLVVPGEL